MDGWTIVYRSPGIHEAELVKGLLESGDILVALDYESAGLICGLTVDGLGEVRVLVPDDQAEAAREALSQHGDEPASSPPDGSDVA